MHSQAAVLHFASRDGADQTRVQTTGEEHAHRSIRHETLVDRLDERVMQMTEIQSFNAIAKVGPFRLKSQLLVNYFIEMCFSQCSI